MALRILHVIRALYGLGGTPRELLWLTKYADTCEHFFFLFGETSDSLSSSIENAGGTIIRVVRNKSYDLRTITDIVNVINKRQIDIVNTHFARADIFGTIAAVLSRTPVIKSVHGLVWNSSILLKRIDSFLDICRAYIIYSSYAALEARDPTSSVNKNIVIHNGIPDSKNCQKLGKAEIREQLGLPESSIIVCEIGGLNHLRKQEDVIEALVKVLRNDLDVHYAIIGNGDKANEMRTRCVELSLENRVHFLGYRSNASNLLPAFDIYVNMCPVEGFGIAVVEAMQNNLPVISVDSGALKELVDNEIHGLCVQSGDITGLSNAIIKLSANRELRLKYGKNARERALTVFCVEKWINRIEKVYTEVLYGSLKYSHKMKT